MRDIIHANAHVSLDRAVRLAPRTTRFALPLAPVFCSRTHAFASVYLANGGARKSSCGGVIFVHVNQ